MLQTQTSTSSVQGALLILALHCKHYLGSDKNPDHFKSYDNHLLTSWAMVSKGIITSWQKMSKFSNSSSHYREGNTQEFNLKFWNVPWSIDQPGRALPSREGWEGKVEAELRVLMPRFCWLVPLVQLGLPRFFLLLILHYRAFVMVPFSWNRLQKSPLTFDRQASKLGLPD